MRTRLERGLERTLFASRWLMAPFYLGLVLALVLLLVKFVQEFIVEASHVLEMSGTETILGILTLVDLSLAGNLLIMVIFAGYENFVSKIEIEQGDDRLDWMGKVDFSGLKLKLIASIVAISGIHLLKIFMNIGSYEERQVIILIVIHLTFVVSGAILAWMDLLVSRANGHE